MGHKHHGKSSAKFLDSDEILIELNLEGSETFMDAGCGDGYISISAIEKYLPEGVVYAVDIHEESMEGLKEYKNENDVENLFNIVGDITEGIHEIEDSSVDVILMINVFHGFKTSQKEDVVIDELKRLVNDDGKIAIVDFNPIEIPHGPPVDIKSSPERLCELFAKHGLEKVYLNDELGADYPNGKSHYMIIFKKE
ncbi:class I SAM-dependent methyltransferase [Methanobrevibacter sp.]|uniref:class I SAM-dependent methyltransferase n=1 Tax=Methanobrevibacter sp. TaxID=66852 RepID=UPI00386539DE